MISLDPFLQEYWKKFHYMIQLHGQQIWKVSARTKMSVLLENSKS